MILFRKYIVIITLFFPTVCFSKTNNIIYINGIQNTYAQHQETVDTIKSILVKSENHSDLDKKINFKISGIWNPVGFYANLNSLGYVEGSDLTEDLGELFLLKTAEEHFSDDFRKILAPYNTDSSVDKEAANRIVSYLDDMTPGNNSLETVAPIITDTDMQRTKMLLKNSMQRLIIMISRVLL
ncbi:MAG: hypothetical protein IPL34_20085 [Thiofilum sp.]|uniref:hypothetical protein n=1 Tax=Thiofilum sp. TaxID=2212733 RepID=UPI0025EEC6DC|nr:hypothetical protein [Thiofilum sp.]MBK8455583.1 hypothetical protein [Thiofilum sp.]